jgi:DNA-binding response OmpR family regulator
MITSPVEGLVETSRFFSNFEPRRGRHILVVEDDAPLANFLSDELQAEFFDVNSVHDGESALSILEVGGRYDLIILDFNLLKLEGLGLLQRISRYRPKTPIIVLSACSRVEDKVTALQSGACDVVVKPFSFLELLARVRGHLRLHSPLIENVSRVGDLTLHRDERRVERNGRRIELTPREFAMLDFMMCNAGRPVTRSKIFEEVWYMRHDPSTNIVDVYMKYVRDKVDLAGERKLIHTIRGIGYVLRDE